MISTRANGQLEFIPHNGAQWGSVCSFGSRGLTIALEFLFETQTVFLWLFKNKILNCRPFIEQIKVLYNPGTPISLTIRMAKKTKVVNFLSSWPEFEN